LVRPARTGLSARWLLEVTSRISPLPLQATGYLQWRVWR
jgi:hypothetical protein